MLTLRHSSLLALALLALMLLGAPTQAETADSELPAAVLAQVHLPLKLVGEGNYRKFGFKIYHASLWAPEGAWNPDKPFVLAMRYARGVSKDTLVDSVMDDVRDEKVADEATLARWKEQLKICVPALKEDDTIIGVSIPGKKAILFHNGEKLTGIDDKAFGDAFFNIWLGPTADEDLQKKLLGRDSE